MATIGTLPNLVDVAKSLDPNGRMAVVAELLSQSNEIVPDIPWKEGNLQTGHRTTSRTALPSVGWRKLNDGIAPSKSTKAQSDEACGMLEAYSEVDQKLAELNGNTQEFRLSEATAFLEAMTQEFVGTLFYGNAGTDPEEFTGFAPRYNSLSGTTGQNILTGAGSGSDNSSIWLIGWGERSAHGIYPKASKAGLRHEDLGLDTVQVQSAALGGKRMRAFIDHWVWECGLALPDWRFVVRIPNIDISNLVAKSSAADLLELMIKATHRIPNYGGIKPVFYMNRTCFQMLDIQTRDDVSTGGQLGYETVQGKRVMKFREIPVRLVDQLTETEAAVS